MMTRSPFFYPANIPPDGFDDADRFMTHGNAVRGAAAFAAIRPEVAAADAGARNTNERVRWLGDRRVGHVLDPHIARCTKNGCTHLCLL
jgi:hypothetical protein